MHCFSCDAEKRLGSGDRVGFRDECDACGADLHVCLNCRHHDPSAYNECRESSSERVSQRDRANRCDYFEPGEGRGGGPAQGEKSARDTLEDLFKKG